MEQVEEYNLVKDPSTNMKNLQHSVEKLIALWEEVEESLIEEFTNIEEEIGGNQIVQFDTFEEVLDTFCGTKRVKEERKQRRTTGQKWLTAEDINFIACRFEIGDRIDVKQFFNFFQDAFYSSSDQVPAATPFQFSHEWSTLKHSAQQDLVSAKKTSMSTPVVEHKSECDEEDSEEPESEPEEEQQPVKPKPSRSPMKETPVPKPTLTKAKSERQNPPVDKEPKKPPVASKSAASLSKKEEPKKKKKAAAAPPVKVFSNTLVALYAKDSAVFESRLERMSSKTGFIMTKEEFRVTLQKHTKDDHISYSNIDNVLNELKFIGGTCSVADLVKYLKACVEAAKEAPPSLAKTPTDQSVPLELVAQGPFVNVRQEHILETLVGLREAKLDRISAEHQTNPAVFLTNLKVHSINNNTGVVDGTGNSITSSSFNQVLREVVPTATKKEVNTLEHELQPSIRKETNDILLSTITSKLKLRTKDFNATASNIKKQEKLLAEEEKRNIRIEERTVKVNDLTLQVQTDSISDQYFSDAKLFMTKLKTGRFGKTMLMADLFTYLKESIPNIKKSENNKFKQDLLEADKTLNAQDPNLYISFAAVEKQLKQRIAVRTKLLKQIDTEKKLLQKDVDKASTVDDGRGWWWCGGGGGGNVHDPNTAPQDLPTDAKQTQKQRSSAGDSSIKNTDDQTDEDDDSPSKPTARGRSSSGGDVHDHDDSNTSDDGQEDLPRYNPSNSSSNRAFQSAMTSDSLAYSDNDDRKSDDSGMFDRRGEEKLMDRKPHPRGGGGRGSRSGGSSRGGFGKPREIDDNRAPSDGSDDDSLIFQSMKKK
jgi:hypothetical protein